jgi:hypothetical protein
MQIECNIATNSREGKEKKAVDCYWIAIYSNNKAVPSLLTI